MASTTPKGLKLLKAESANKGNRRDEWNRLNDKAKKYLDYRIADWEKIKDPAHEMHKPGSMKAR